MKGFLMRCQGMARKQCPAMNLGLYGHILASIFSLFSAFQLRVF